jgi:hypothetical protein
MSEGWMNEAQRRKKLLNLINRLVNDQYLRMSETELDLVLQRIQHFSPDPDITEYVFPTEELSPKAIVEKAFQYKPVVAGWNG